MPAYVIVLREEPVQDPEAFAEYQSRTRKIAPNPTLIPRVIYGQTEGLEGEAPDGMIMLEFPTMEEAKAWYNNPDYQAALPYRLQSARWRAFIVEGLPSAK